MYLLACTRKQDHISQHNFVFILMNGKTSSNLIFPISQPVHFKSKFQVSTLMNHFIYIAVRREALVPCQKCCMLGAVQIAPVPAEEFLITYAISRIHFHSELQKKYKGNHISDQL